MDLLTQHVPAAICTSGPDFQSQAMSDDPDASWECAAAVSVAGDGRPLVAEVSDCPSQEAARQQAALALLRCFQSRFCQILQPGLSTATCTDLQVPPLMVKYCRETYVRPAVYNCAGSKVVHLQYVRPGL